VLLKPLAPETLVILGNLDHFRHSFITSYQSVIIKGGNKKNGCIRLRKTGRIPAAGDVLTAIV
jgi:hypothetical protein